MARVLQHRGPDDEGIWVGRSAGLGNRRLSIIDLDGGHQPIANEEQTLWLVFNGEVYNYRSLRRQLIGRGHRFGTATDSEVVLHLYEEVGARCVEQLEGMFAFAIWDERQQQLFLARDHFGQKPVYYCCHNGAFLFASEIKAILAEGSVSAQMDPLAMHDWLSLRFVPPPRTMLAGIRKLPAAHRMTVDAAGIRLERYWQLQYLPKRRQHVSDALAQFETLLEQAVQRHTVSDVPVGALLSGGLDSGLVVAMLARNTSAPVPTFSVGVAEQDWSELPFAAAVARRYGCDHHEAVVQADVLQLLPQLIWHLDEPSDPSATCKYLVARAAGRRVKVALGGDGGDEMLGGYDRYAGHRLISYYCWLPRTLRRLVSRAVLRRIPESFAYKSLAQKMRWIDQMSESDAARRYAMSVNFFRLDEPTKRALYGPKQLAQVDGRDSVEWIADFFRQAPVQEAVDRMLFADVMTQLPEHGCMIVDRTSMAVSLESRSPFLDRELAEFCATLPTDWKIRGWRIRYLQRQLARRLLPPEVAQRPKQGFGLPFGYWFRGRLGRAAEQLFQTSALVEDGHFDGQGLLHILDQHRNQGINHSHRLWLLVNLEIWYRIFIRDEAVDELANRSAEHVAV